jgi:hypothetical protein
VIVTAAVISGVTLGIFVNLLSESLGSALTAQPYWYLPALAVLILVGATSAYVYERASRNPTPGPPPPPEQAKPVKNAKASGLLLVSGAVIAASVLLYGIGYSMSGADPMFWFIETWLWVVELVAICLLFTTRQARWGGLLIGAKAWDIAWLQLNWNFSANLQNLPSYYFFAGNLVGVVGLACRAFSSSRSVGVVADPDEWQGLFGFGSDCPGGLGDVVGSDDLEGADGEVAGPRHHHDRESRACTAMRPNRSQPGQLHRHGT